MVEALVGGIGVGVEVEAIPIPSAASTPGYQGGGQHLMPASMRQLFLIWDMAIHTMVATTRPIPLTDRPMPITDIDSH